MGGLEGTRSCNRRRARAPPPLPPPNLFHSSAPPLPPLLPPPLSPPPHLPPPQPINPPHPPTNLPHPQLEELCWAALQLLPSPPQALHGRGTSIIALHTINGARVLAEDCDFICRDARSHTFAAMVSTQALLTLQRCGGGAALLQHLKHEHRREP
jgi:hypothetical protein